jgi:hypothetical protein
MMRDDPENWEDIGFLLNTAPDARRELPVAIAAARIPPLVEIQEIFNRMKPRVLQLALALRS